MGAGSLRRRRRAGDHRHRRLRVRRQHRGLDPPNERRRSAAPSSGLHLAAAPGGGDQPRTPYRPAAEQPGGLLEVGPFKLFTDGSLNTRTALCHEAYPGSDPGEPGSHGLEMLSPREQVSLLRRASSHGIEPAVHAIGDRANEMALNAFETVRVTVGIQPTHAVDDRDVADRHWAGRTHRAYAFADLLAAGAVLELGSDAPVAPLDPWLTVASAVTRTDDERPSWHPEQRIPVADAPAGSSQGRRLIRVGDRADLVVTDGDPLTADARTLREMPVLATMLAGGWTHGPSL
ncbi:hypothetical protein VT50_0207425 [Streptomyces antioxidans]|uniref:Amidohydrolase 3 domain-containing protein n=1 Tax=Streptomyces antioxidans TaxID=1507734 RepID=A0A1V4D9V6_9ACTN|nr:hypothetical protein VT50_0207425 [Streptomyces antioxidans]